MKFNLKRFFIVTLGTLILTIGLYFFLMPQKLVVGGVSGLSLALNHFFPSIPVGGMMFIINIILLVLAYFLLGKAFLGYTLYSSLLLSGLISLLEMFLPMTGPMVDDIFLNLIFGILISGSGMGIILYQDASTGGTDIIAMILNKYLNIKVGISLMMADFFITILGLFAFGVRIGLYSLLGVIINSVVIDKIIAGFNNKINMFIISEKYEEINEFIQKEMDRGTTLYYAEGGHTRDKKMVVNVIVSTREYIQIRQFIKSIDRRVFISVNLVTEVFGEGFTEPEKVERKD